MSYQIKVTSEGISIEHFETQTLESLQAFVKGFIEVAPPQFRDENITVVCNEEGKILGLPVTAVSDIEVFNGSLFICSSDHESEDGVEFVALDKAQVLQVFETLGFPHKNPSASFPED